MTYGPAAAPSSTNADPAAAPLSWDLAALTGQLRGELHTGATMRRIYATDASAYQQLPLAVAIPETEADLVALVRFAAKHSLGLIPRAAGTSLAGQVVGSGIVVDVSRHFTDIVAIDAAARTVTVQPGVIRNELNAALAPHGLLFGPETSTQNRAMMGGMLGNNSCGSNSIRYGSVRDHIVEVQAILADGSRATFGPLDRDQFIAKCRPGEADDAVDLETRIYRRLRDLLGDGSIRDEIRRQFPHPEIRRRNTGYAVDALLDSAVFDPASGQPLNLGQLIAGSEGTLCLVTQLTLACEPLPPPVAGLLCAQFTSVGQALQATQHAVAADPYACELIDHHILDCTRRSIEHQQNRFFLDGEPQAVLVTELRGRTQHEVQDRAEALEQTFRDAGLGYAFPVLFGEQMLRVWELRKAGLGLLGNVVGDEKAVPVIEDTAVRVADLPAYIDEVDRTLAERFGLECVHYAHAGSGELHLRPILNLKTADGHRLFREVAAAVANIVKRYRGSLSGEHGDGRLRGEFLETMIGERCYRLIREVKRAWDPHGVFNPGKIVDTPPMNTHLRYAAGAEPHAIETVFDWSGTLGMLGAAEMCNGSGDCRKTPHAGGTMCPSYHATRSERDTTRARANLLRRALTRGPGELAGELAGEPVDGAAEHPLASDELADVLDLCLSCKGCKSECPSTVDLAKLKAETMQARHDARGIPRRSRLVAGFARTQALLSRPPLRWAYNAAMQTAPIRRLLARAIGFHPDRTVPPLPPRTLRQWLARRSVVETPKRGRVLLLVDEFTNHLDVETGIATVELLEALGYAATPAAVTDTGRSALSKGLLRQARETIAANVAAVAPHVSDDVPLVGIEPSALLTFRDEALDLHLPEAAAVADASLLLDEFLVREAAAGRIDSSAFSPGPRRLLVHGHCFQKALVGMSPTQAALALLPDTTVELIASGCCGMAGSFGYEAEHYDLSMQIGELVLLPAVRDAAADVTIVAAGTSCRHQIHDGTGRRAVHPAVVLRDALAASPQ